MIGCTRDWRMITKVFNRNILILGFETSIHILSVVTKVMIFRVKLIQQVTRNLFPISKS